MNPELHRQVILDMGVYWWHYEDAIITTKPDGTLQIRCAPGHAPPRLYPKEGTP